MRRFILSLLGAAAATLAVVQSLPTTGACGGGAPIVTSFATLHGHCVAENVLHYVTSLAVALAIAYAFRPRAAAVAGSGSANPGAILLALAAVVAVNAGLESGVAAKLTDTFHEGEALAFGPAFARAEPFANAVLVHGFGMDVLPDVLARSVYPGSVIAGVRLFKALQAIAYFAALLWALFEVFAFEPDARRRRLLQLAAVAGLVPILSIGGFGHELLRKSVLMLQFAGALRALRKDRGWLLLGASVPFGFFYNYAEGAAGALLLAGAVLARPRRIPSIAIGGAVASIGFLAWIGFAQASEIARQIAYWGKTGGPTWMLPLADDWVQVALLFAPLVAVQAVAAVRFRRGEPDVWLSLLLSLSSFRCWTDRADTIHLVLAAATSLPLLFALVQRTLPRPSGIAFAWPRAAIPALFAVGLVPLAPFAALGPVGAVTKSVAALRDARTPDAQLLDPALLSAAAAIAPEVQAAPCFFTMTSEGVWYHVLDKPSCSRFHHLVYARTDEAQRELVAALERERPPVILGTTRYWSNAIDGVPTTVTNPIVWRYVAEHYGPADAHGFLHRSVGVLSSQR